MVLPSICRHQTDAHSATKLKLSNTISSPAQNLKTNKILCFPQFCRFSLNLQRNQSRTNYKSYSVVGLVLPRGEEQISGPSALSKLKKPSKRSQKGPRSCQKYSKLCYDHFGGRLEASNPPPLFTLSQSEGYWTVSSFFLLHRISFHQAHSISHFLANHISAEQKVGLMAEVWQN